MGFLKKFTKQEISWMMYDWANSAHSVIIVTLLPIFFDTVAGYTADSVSSMSTWGYATSIAMLIVALAAPILGVFGDIRGMRKKLFTAFMLIGVVSVAGLSFTPFMDFTASPDAAGRVAAIVLVLYITSTIGFDAPVESRKNRDVGKLLAQVEPHDLMKFGIIPELIGRMPMIACLESLSQEDLVRIMVEPKNAIVRQYQKLLEMDGVALEITEDAMKAVAKKAIDRQIGARGLRAILEKIMTNIMFQIPSDLTIQKVILTPECVEGGQPTIVRDPAHPREPLNGKK